MLDKSRIGQRTSLHAHGFVAAAVKLLQAVELFSAYGPVEAHPHSLRDGRILAAIHRKSTRDAPDRRAACGTETSERLRTFDRSLRFGKFHTSSQFQIQK